MKVAKHRVASFEDDVEMAGFDALFKSDARLSQSKVQGPQVQGGLRISHAGARVVIVAMIQREDLVENKPGKAVCLTINLDEFKILRSVIGNI